MKNQSDSFTFEDSIKNEIRLEVLALGAYAKLPLNDEKFSESFNFICSLLDKLMIRDGFGNF